MTSARRKLISVELQSIIFFNCFYLKWPVDVQKTCRDFCFKKYLVKQIWTSAYFIVPLGRCIKNGLINFHYKVACWSLNCLDKALERIWAAQMKARICPIVKQYWLLPFMHCLYLFFWHFINTTAYLLGRNAPSSLLLKSFMPTSSMVCSLWLR